MARAFSPSRGAYYGAPEHEALAGLGADLMTFFQRRSDEEIEAERIRQLSNGRMALLRERHALFGKMTAERAKDPQSWVPTLRRDRDKIRKAVMAGITQPQAKQALELQLQQQLDQWEFDLDDRAQVQAAQNAAADFEANYDSFYTESVEFADLDDAMAYLADALNFLEDNHNPKGLAVHDKVATRTATEFEKRNLTRHIVGNYLLQQALQADDDGLIDLANAVAPRSALDDQKDKPLFGPEELGELKARYRQIARAAKAEADAQRQARADAFETDVTNRLLSGQFRMADAGGKELNIYEAIVANPDITPANKRSLSNLYESCTKEKTVVDPQAAVAMEIILDRVATGQMSLGDGIRTFGKISGDMSAEQRNTYYQELTGKQSTWVAGLRTKARGIINDVTNRLPTKRDKKGNLVPYTEQEALEAVPDNAAASQAAQLLFYRLVREAVAKDEPLKEDTFIPLALSVAEQVQRERAAYGMAWIKARYLSPAVGPKEEVKKDITYSHVSTGEDYVAGRPSRRTVKPSAGEKEPESVQEFYQQVGRLKATDMTAARKYYDQWSEKFK